MLSTWERPYKYILLGIVARLQRSMRGGRASSEENDIWQNRKSIQCAAQAQMSESRLDGDCICRYLRTSNACFSHECKNDDGLIFFSVWILLAFSEPNLSFISIILNYGCYIIISLFSFRTELSWKWSLAHQSKLTDFLWRPAIMSRNASVIRTRILLLKYGQLSADDGGVLNIYRQSTHDTSRYASGGDELSSEYLEQRSGWSRRQDRKIK